MGVVRPREPFLPLDTMLMRYMLSSCVCAVRQSVRQFFRSSVCPSHASIVPQQLNTGSHKQHRTIAQVLLFSDA